MTRSGARRRWFPRRTVAASALTVLAASATVLTLAGTPAGGTPPQQGPSTPTDPATPGIVRATIAGPGETPTDGETTPSDGQTTPGQTPPTTQPTPEETKEVAECKVGDGDTANPAEPWAQKRLQFDRIERLSRGKGVTIAVIDSGVSFYNKQFWAQIVPNRKLSEVKPEDLGASFVADKSRSLIDDGNSWYNDCDGHGTAVTGILAAKSMQGQTVRGIAQAARILTYRYTHSTPKEGEERTELHGDNSDIGAAVDQAVADGADIINISSSSTSRRSLQEPVQRAIDAGVLVVAAAGNSANAGNRVMYPAALPGVMAVGAIDEKGKRADFSQSSFPLSVAAPGSGLTLLSTNGRGYWFKKKEDTSGTSFAAPYVAGTAALVMSAYPDLSAAQVKRRIEQTADPAGQSSLNTMGHGIVNPYEALTAVLPDDAGSPLPEYEQGGPIADFQPPKPTDTSDQRIALAVAGGAMGAAALIGGGVVVVRRGRARGWRVSRRTRGGGAAASTDLEPS